MNGLPGYCARAGLAIAVAGITGCASDPALNPWSALGALGSVTSEVAIVTGRTVFDAVGVGIKVAPPPADPVPAAPAYLR